MQRPLAGNGGLRFGIRSLLLGETGGSFLLPTAIKVTQLFLMKR
ncbi:MAG TPA: hypothetical protein PLQ97_03685 [Myxococcota bacterium]|nr:hypothetical protein [Myxococcota bacterium]HQK50042.1 hypothetical protein [Myxococcota bacterium]